MKTVVPLIDSIVLLHHTCTRSFLSCLLAIYGIPIFNTFLIRRILFKYIGVTMKRGLSDPLVYYSHPSGLHMSSTSLQESRKNVQESVADPSASQMSPKIIFERTK